MKILIIEDNLVNLKLMQILTKNLGFETTNAENGQEGLDIMTVIKPNLILCDIQMPVLDGFGFITKLREMEGINKTPVYALTAMAMSGDKEIILKKGFDGYISKPINTRELREFLINFKNSHLNSIKHR